VSSTILKTPLPSLTERLQKNTRLIVRLVLGGLLLANLVVATAVFRPWGGSPEQLQQQLMQLAAEVENRQQSVNRLRALAGNVEKTRADANQFMNQYFLDGATAFSTVIDELRRLAEEAGVKAKDHSFDVQPVEGSDTLAMLNITGNYEGSYSDLIHFVNAIDRSPRFLTIERLQAQPLQSAGVLNINLRINAFIRREGETQ